MEDEDKKYLSELCPISCNNYHEGKTVYIADTGVYELAFKSKLPTAKAFKRWVFKEVLPSIRKTGGYELEAAKKQIAIKDEALTKKDEKLAKKDKEIAKKVEEAKKEDGLGHSIHIINS